MGHLHRDDDELESSSLEEAASAWIEGGLLTPKEAEETVEVVMRVRMQARQIIEQLNLPTINNWTRLVQLLEAALARVDDGHLLEQEISAQVEEKSGEDPKIVEGVRMEAADIIWHLEPAHIHGRFDLKQILERPLRHAQLQQWLHSEKSKT
jgi:hypothetical protein